MCRCWCCKINLSDYFIFMGFLLTIHKIFVILTKLICTSTSISTSHSSLSSIYHPFLSDSFSIHTRFSQIWTLSYLDVFFATFLLICSFSYAFTILWPLVTETTPIFPTIGHDFLRSAYHLKTWLVPSWYLQLYNAFDL